MKKLLGLFLLLFVLTGCFDGIESNSVEDLEAKYESEIRYLESKIFNLYEDLSDIHFNKYAIVQNEQEANTTEDEDANSQGKESKNTSTGGESSSGGGGESKEKDEKSKELGTNLKTELTTNLLKKEKEINWTKIASLCEELQSLWSEIVLDYTQISKKENADAFSERLNQLAIEVGKTDREKSLELVGEIYAEFSNILKYVRNDDIMYANMLKAKLIQNQILATNEKWDEINMTDLDVLDKIKNEKYLKEKIQFELKNYPQVIEKKDIGLLNVKMKIVIEDLNELRENLD